MTNRLFTLALIFLSVPLFAAPSHLAGSMRLGDPVRQDDGQYRLPLIITTDTDSVAPQAFCFKLNFSAPVTSAVVQHAGVTQGRAATFDWQNATATALSHLVVYDPSALSMPSGVSIIVADVVIAYPDTVTPLSIDFDASSLTMISNQGGTLSATQSKGTLAVAGATINPTSWYAPPAPVPPPPVAEPAPPQRRRSSGH
jgi:hypothetical protein